MIVFVSRPLVLSSGLLLDHRLHLILIEKNTSAQLLGGLTVSNSTKVQDLMICG